MNNHERGYHSGYAAAIHDARVEGSVAYHELNPDGTAIAEALAGVKLALLKVKLNPHLESDDRAEIMALLKEAVRYLAVKP